MGQTNFEMLPKFINISILNHSLVEAKIETQWTIQHSLFRLQLRVRNVCLTDDTSGMKIRTVKKEQIIHQQSSKFKTKTLW